MADEDREQSYSLSHRHALTVAADAQQAEANADPSKDLKAEEMGEPVRVFPLPRLRRFVFSHVVFQSAAEKASSGLQEKLDQNALPIRAYLEQVRKMCTVVLVVALTLFQAVVPILLQGMSALVKERFAPPPCPTIIGLFLPLSFDVLLNAPAHVLRNSCFKYQFSLTVSQPREPRRMAGCLFAQE